jgi:hypothetical protein
MEKGVEIKRLFLHLLSLGKTCNTLNLRNMLNLLREKMRQNRYFREKTLLY